MFLLSQRKGGLGLEVDLLHHGIWPLATAATVQLTVRLFIVVKLRANDRINLSGRRGTTGEASFLELDAACKTLLMLVQRRDSFGQP